MAVLHRRDAAVGRRTPPRAAPLGPELAFLAGAQNADGGFGGARGQSSSELYTAWAAMGLAAAGRNPAGVRRGGHSVLDSLRGGASTPAGARRCRAHDPRAARLRRLGLLLRGPQPGRRSAAGRARATAPSPTRSTSPRSRSSRCARSGIPPGFAAIREAAGWIERQQNADGGFGFGVRGSPSDVDDTAAALQALVDAGARNARVLAAAAGFLTRAQNLDGGYPQQPGGESNAQSTAWAVQGLIAAGRNPGAVRRRGSRSPLGYLESLRSPGGSIRYSRTGAQTPVWVTAQALIALAGKTFPIGG